MPIREDAECRRGYLHIEELSSGNYLSGDAVEAYLSLTSARDRPNHPPGSDDFAGASSASDSLLLEMMRIVRRIEAAIDLGQEAP